MPIGVENMDLNSVPKLTIKPYWSGRMNRTEAIQKCLAALSYLDQEKLEAIFHHGGIIAGGFFADVLLGRKYKDIDVYFPSVNAAERAYSDINSYPVSQGNTNLRSGYFEFMRFLTFPTAQEVIDSFDLSCVQIAYDGNMFYFGEHTLEDMNSKYLRLLRVNCPLAIQTQRLTKYMQKGFVPDEHTFGVMCKHIKQGGDSIKTQYEDYNKPAPDQFGWLDDLLARGRV